MIKKLLVVLSFCIIFTSCTAKKTQNETTSVNPVNIETKEAPENNKSKEVEVKDMKALNEELILAAEKADNTKLQNLIKQGADINYRDSSGRTPAMAATYKNNTETVKLLIQAGADINIRDNHLNNPFLYAGAEGFLEILKLTIEAGADAKSTNRFGGTALIPASEHGYVEVIKELLTKTDINVNHINNLGWTALLEAIILNNGGEKQQQVIKMLIEHGADVNIADKNNITPLKHAEKKGYTKIQQILKNAGAH